ncbi:hypothetical protein SY89_02596 [Halolamina pelagica]|jgi:hypothetical protein|uniref:Uncharacterized protein n=1 Tax=Halolamina pelagica TaxID=699431 RepID=A0A0P7H0T5_9EURY|nr:hypothetical protein [Halolamina pelagica]KPN31841.1 hypothetical protein SY89_02596 [Halolamina pelagica]
MSVRNGKRLRYPLGVVALVVGIGLLQGVLELLVQRAVAGGLPTWLPTLGTTGQTVTAYVLAGNAYTYLLVPAAAFWLGVRYARAAA